MNFTDQLLIGDILERGAFKEPNREAFIYKNTRVTYKELEDRSKRVASWLIQQGIRKNDKVGFMLKNSLAFVEIFFGVSFSGGVGVPINFRLQPKEIEYVVNNSDTKILFIDEDYVDIIQSIRSKLPKVETVVVVGEENVISSFENYETIFATDPSFTLEEKIEDDDPLLILYTSGTTGLPKGAVLTHKNIVINNLCVIWQGKEDLHNKQLTITPLFHIAGISAIVRTTLLLGTTVIHRQFEPEQILQTIEQEKINVLVLVPTMWNMLLRVPNIKDYDLTSVRICKNAGAIAPIELKKKILSHFPNAELADAFGQTEAASSTIYLSGEDALRKPESVGRPILMVEVRIVDENMNDVSVGEVGEIVYKGPTIMKEYYNNPEATKEAFRGGWFHSGDLVRRDEEGYYYVVDRKNNMIISGGENIYPAEIEEVLMDHPAVQECAVIGVPDEVWGENVKAFIVKKPGHEVSAEEIIEFTKQHLASYKKPKEVEFIDELPKNASGKILKFELKEKSIKSTAL